MKFLQLTPTPKRILTAVRGFTLVELMVSIVIGLIVLGAVSQVFVTSQSTYNVEEGLSRLQENGRFAMGFIAEDVRMAGYIGCQDQSGSVNVQLNNAADFPITGQMVTGHRYTGSGGQDPAADWTPPLPAVFNFGATEAEPDSDVIVVRRASEQAFRLVAPYMTTETDPLEIDSGVGGALQVDQLVMVADCKAADLFQITDITSGTIQHDTSGSSPGNANNALSQLYGSDAEVMTLVTNAYFVGMSPAGTPALFRKQLEGGTPQARELVENIEALKFFFGVDSDNTGVANQYLTAQAIGAGSPLWATIASVRMGLVARTPNETGADWDKAVYSVVGDSGIADDFDPTDDRRQRRVFTSTINIRNYTQFTK